MVTWRGSVAVVRRGVLWCVMAACQHIRMTASAYRPEDFDGSFRRKDKAACKQTNSRNQNTQEYYANWVCFLFLHKWKERNNALTV